MATALLSVRVDSEDKRRFDDFCANAGMNVSVAVNMFIKAALRENRLPFEVRGDPFYSGANRERLRRSIADVESGRAAVKEHELIEDEGCASSGRAKPGRIAPTGRRRIKRR